uniref:Uncharacterized protein n=1 Tax=Tetranychus urticae TaxID=32264 RepID=T1K805_TETUR
MWSKKTNEMWSESFCWRFVRTRV